MSTLKDKDVNNMTLGESLKSIRKKYKMTQGDVAKLLGISRSGYTYYETDTTVPSIETLKKLAVIYDTSVDDIVGMPIKKEVSGKDSASSLLVAESHIDPLMYMKKEEQALIMAFRLLSDEEKKQVSEMTLSLLSENKEEN